MATEIYFVRHGESLDNVAGVTFDEMDVNEEGTLDNPLSELGRRQAAATADWFQGRVAVDSVVSSGLARTDLTAAPIAARFGLDVETLPEMQEVKVERDALGNLKIENAVSRTLYRLPGGKRFRQHLFEAGFTAAFTKWVNFGIEGFEPAEDLFARAAYCLDTLAAMPGRRIAAVAHSFFISAMLVDLGRKNLFNWMAFPHPMRLLPNCSVTCIVAHPPRFRVRYAGRKTSDLH